MRATGSASAQLIPAPALAEPVAHQAQSKLTIVKESSPMPAPAEQPITLAQMREVFYSAVVCDALDALGFPHQSPRVPLQPLTTSGVLIGRCKTTLWADMAHPDPEPYELELKA